jgi:hypothetical protein
MGCDTVYKFTVISEESPASVFRANGVASISRVHAENHEELSKFFC